MASEGESVSNESKNRPLSLDQKASELYQEYGFENLSPAQETAIGFAGRYLEKHGVGVEFIEDRTNLAILLGVSELVTAEEVDPGRKKRLENLSFRLVHPFIEGEKLPAAEIWGTEKESGGLDLDDEEVWEKIAEHTDPKATAKFRRQNDSQINSAIAHWQNDLGTELTVDVHILDMTVVEFAQEFRAGGLISVPDDKTESSARVRIVLPASALDVNSSFVSHELYHLEDYGNYIRRGPFQKVLAWVDELHTEYEVRNYRQHNEGSGIVMGQYVTAKNYWDRITANLDVDFDTLHNRKLLLDVYARKFGFSGLAEQSLFSESSSNTVEGYKTFILPWTTMFFSAGFADRRTELAKDPDSLKQRIPAMLANLDRLAMLMTPETNAKHLFHRKQLSQMVPSIRDKHIITARRAAEEKIYNGWRISTDEAKRLIGSYFEAVVLLEQCDLENITLDGEYQAIAKALLSVPTKRIKGDFDLQSEFDKRMNETQTDPNRMREFASRMIHEFVSGTGEVYEMAFAVRSIKTRELLLANYREEVIKMGDFAQKHGSEFVQWFVEGINRFASMPMELKAYTEELLETEFPSMTPLIEAERGRWEEKSKKVGNFNFK